VIADGETRDVDPRARKNFLRVRTFRDRDQAFLDSSPRQNG
jgi:hypothetical protein